jgi:hypothetical protein
LELGVVAKEIEVPKALLLACSGRGNSGSSSRASTTRAATGSAALLSSEIEKVHVSIVIDSASGGDLRLSRRGAGRCLLSLQICGNSLSERGR